MYRPHSYSDIVTKIYPLVLLAMSLLGFFSLVTSQGASFPVMAHRVWTMQSLHFTGTMETLLLSTFLVWVVLTVIRGVKIIYVFPVVVVFSLSFLGLELFAGLAALTGVAISLFFFKDYMRLLGYLVLLVIILEFFSLLHWLFLYPAGIGVLAGVAGFEAQVYYLFAQVGPWLYLSLSFIVLFLFSSTITKPILGEKTRESQASSSNLGLVVLVLVSFLAAAYPYIPSVNPKGVTAGIDAFHYLEAYEGVEDNLLNIFSVYEGSRPTIFLIIYFLRITTGAEVLSILRFLPFAVYPMLVYATYGFTLEVLGDNETAVWASFFTLTGVQLTVGAFSYYVTNMLALVFMYMSLICLFRYLRLGSVLVLAASIFFAGLTVFTHPWTSDQYVGSAVLTAIITGYFEWRGNLGFTKTRALFAYILGVFAFYLLKSWMVTDIKGTFTLITLADSFTSVSQFLFQLQWGTLYKYGGLMANILAILLLIAGVFSIKPKNDTLHYLFNFISASSLVFLVGNESIKSRILYNIPIGIFMAVGLLNLTKDLSNRRTVLGAVVLFQLAYLLRSFANIV